MIPEQSWPEYLEDWEYLYKDRLQRTAKDFIFNFLVARRQKIARGDHFHLFATGTLCSDEVLPPNLNRNSDSRPISGLRRLKIIASADCRLRERDPSAESAR